MVRHISGTPSTETEAWSRFLGYFGHWQVKGYGMFSLVDKSSGQFLGNVGYSDFRRGLGADFDPFHEAAWVLAAAGHGKGYALEAMTAVQQWLDDSFRPEKTVCIISPDNSPSLRLAEKLGFRAMRQAEYNQKEVTVFERSLPL